MTLETDLVDLVDHEGNPVSTKPRDEIIRGLDRYHSIFVILISHNGKLILSKIPPQRDDRDMYGNCWSTTVATLRRHDESRASAAMRALRKEVGIDGIGVGLVGESLLELDDGYEQYASLFIAQHEMPSYRNPEDVADMREFSRDALRMAMTENPGDFAATFTALWNEFNHYLNRI